MDWALLVGIAAAGGIARTYPLRVLHVASQHVGEDAELEIGARARDSESAASGRGTAWLRQEPRSGGFRGSRHGAGRR